MNDPDFSRTTDPVWNVLDALDAEIAVVSAGGEILAVNAAWERSSTDSDLGPTLRPLIGMNYLQTFANARDEHVADTAKAGIASVLAGRQYSFSLEYSLGHPAHERWFLLDATILPGESDARHVVISHLDITSRKQWEDALVASEARFRSLIMHGMEAISIADANGTILYEVPAIE